MHLLLCFLLLVTTHLHNVARADNIETSGPSVLTEGKEALLTCVIMSRNANDTVLWRKEHGDVLTAGMNRVTSDRRFAVLHDEAPKGKRPSGGDVFVLQVKDTKSSDSGAYVCEVNSDPIQKSIFVLKVKSLSSSHAQTPSAVAPSSASLPMIPPPSPSDTLELPAEPPMITHDFVDCCLSANVSTACLGYCAVHNILDGTTGTEPELCEKDFPSIVKCMADGRNHQKCCEKQNIPDICQDMCIGVYTPYTDLAKSRVSCVMHTIPTLKCILQGIQYLPSEPTNVVVEPVNERSLEVSWSRPDHLADTVTKYMINVTTLHSFDQDSLTTISPNRSVVVSNDLDSTVINYLEPFTMYVITVTAYNDVGASLPSYRVRALTLENGSGTTQTSVAVVPVLPDVRGCCVKNGMTHRTCLDRMCDPKKADFTEIPDLMVCAPWANITFTCLANRIDHTPCCMARGIPSDCLSFCAGNVTSITFSVFKCLRYMSEYSSCLLQGYGVLPGAPTRVKAPMLAPQFAIVEWSAPKILPDTVTTYQVFVRRLAVGDDYAVIEKEHPPVILEDLNPGVFYETYVVAVNAHGKSDPSPRIVFRTKRERDVEPVVSVYNITTCCLAAGLMPQCMPLCTYDLKVSDMTALGATCTPQLGSLAKCAAAGRDHSPCCTRRSVPSQCSSLCRGVLPASVSDCMPYSGNIIQCMEEGSDHIPGPIEDLRATAVTNTSIALEWIPSRETSNSSDNQIDDYLVQYGKVNNMTMYETVVKLENEINTTDTEIELSKLEPSSIYRILVVARGAYGTSLPSSMLLINTSNTADPLSASMYGAPSPPHSLAMSEHSATWVTVAWQPPEFSHPHEVISYKIFHKSGSDDKFSFIGTRLLWVRLSNLKPNTQYVIYVLAIGPNGTSLPSETLVAWTDPALSAFVDPPTIHPADFVPEGGSMTVLCLALGNPAPTISLYVGGHLVRQDTSRHMVTTIHNVTTDMQHVSCYADNGYGTPMQASKRIHISSAPQIKASGITLAMLGDRVDLKCTVRAQPPPKVMFWRDHEGRVPVIIGKFYNISLSINSDDPTQSVMTLTILKLTNEFVGDYFCHAENALGAATSAVSVRIRPVPAAHNVSECCMAQNVSSTCMDACSFYVDLDTVKDRPECISDFNKLMKCAADGSDHRACCARAEVPRQCLDWCRGEPVMVGGAQCVLQYTKSIVDCFQSNRELLPSAPLNVAVQVVSDDEAQISWEVPLKNPHTVEGYRIYWREADSAQDDVMQTQINGMGTNRADTKDLNLRLTELKKHVVYELVVKAGNHFGSSVMTSPIWFSLGDNQVTSASNSSTAGVVCGILAGIISIALALAAVYFYQKRRTMKLANGVAFENPSYLREVNMEHVQISAVTPASETNGSRGSEWRQERLQSPSAMSDPSPSATEVNPSLYEELKLGHDGVGFKRLVS